MNAELDKAFNEVFGESINAMVSPESQAWADYVDGKNQDANPYTKDSVEWGRYRVAMRREFARARNRSVEP